MKNIILLCVFFWHFLYAIDQENSTKANEEELLAQKLFEKAFKKKISNKKLYFPLKVNGIVQDEVLIKIDASEHVSIEENTVKYIISLLKKKYQKKLIYHKSQDNFIALSELNQMGIESHYDRDNITINISIPPLLKKATTLRLNQHRAINLEGSVIPENYAGGVNFYLNEYYKDSNEKGTLQRDPLVGSSDMFLNIKNFVLEGRVNYQEVDDSFDRDRVRMVKDDEANLIRYSMGDIFLPSQYRMSYPQSLGMSIEKKSELSRDFAQNSSRVNSYEFFLKERSRVEIYINDQYKRALHLNAGTHNLYDLGIPSGLNQVKLKIIEDNGKIEFISFNDFSYSEVLKKGTLRYGLGLGISSQKKEHQLVYNKDEKLLSAYVDYGLFDAITTKFGLQITEAYQAMAVELVVGTNWGLLDPYVIYSQTDNINGLKKGLEYRTNIGSLNINFGYESSDENFKRLDNYQQEVTDASTLYRVNLYTPIGLGINIGVTASQYTKSDEKEMKYGLKVYKNLFHSLATRIDIDSTKKDDDPRETVLSLSLEYRLGRERVGYTNYPKDKAYQISSTYTAHGKYGFSNNMEYDHLVEQDKYYMQAHLKDEKFKLDTTYTVNKNNISDHKNQSVGLQLSTGFVFAGDTATITEPINSSFVIVNNDDKLKQALGIDGYQDMDDHIYHSYALQIGDYIQRELSVDESELDFGIDLEKTTQSFYSNYRSGSVMDIKVQNVHSVTGVLVDKKTLKPISKKAFKLFNTETGKKSMAFTNAMGQFTIEQVDIGKYNAILMREEQYDGVAKFTFEVKADAQHFIDLGAIKIQMPQKKDTKKYIIFNGKKEK